MPFSRITQGYYYFYCSFLATLVSKAGLVALISLSDYYKLFNTS